MNHWIPYKRSTEPHSIRALGCKNPHWERDNLFINFISWTKQVVPQVHRPAVMLTINKETLSKKKLFQVKNPQKVSKLWIKNRIFVKLGVDNAENVMKNVIMVFQFNPVTHLQDTYKNFNQKLQSLNVKSA